ncbi:MAG: DUF3160 domain-containing protein [Candidatus Hodarchaeales archaeon]
MIRRQNSFQKGHYQAGSSNKAAWFGLALLLALILVPLSFSQTKQGAAAKQPKNFGALLKMFPLTESQKKILLTNGFLVLDDVWIEECSDFYYDIFDSDVGVFVTADVMLHLFHLLSEDMLMEIENYTLYDELASLTAGMYQTTLRDYNGAVNGSQIQAALKSNLIVFGVGAKLLALNITIPDVVIDGIELILGKIANHSIIEFFPGEDYTQYTVRGHYEGYSKLEQYFLAMKWLGRRIFRFWDEHDPLSAKLELRQAVLFSLQLQDNQTLLGSWRKIYNVTSYLANTADSLTPPIILQAIAKCLGTQASALTFEDDANIALLQDELRNDIYPNSQIIPVPTAFPGQLPSKYIQFMGERFLPDSAVFQNITFPHTPPRCPSALEIATTVLGSKKAETLLINETGQVPQLANILQNARTYFDSRSSPYWNQSMYNGWLRTLRTLTAYETRSRSTSYPWFLQIEPWLALRLNSMLASWTQLRHDVILYGKQTAVPASAGLVHPGYVEPVSAFWDSLQELVLTLNQTCNPYFPPPNEGDSSWISNLYDKQIEKFVDLCSNFGNFARKLENGKTLSDRDQYIIHGFGMNLLSFFSIHTEDKSPALIADVLTEPNLGVILHEATGHFNPVLIAYKHGKDYVAGAGLVFSYYELQTDLTRTTDSQWLQRLADEDIPDRPLWTKEFLESNLYQGPEENDTHFSIVLPLTAVIFLGILRKKLKRTNRGDEDAY